MLGRAADAVMRADLNLVPWLLSESQCTRLIIRQNLVWASANNLVALPLAALGVISPAIAATKMAATSLPVVGNSFRLGR